MQTRETHRFARSYGEAPPAIHQAFDKQVRLLVSNLRHPSLRAELEIAGLEIVSFHGARG